MKRCMIYAVIVLFLLPLCGMAKKRTSKEERTNNHSAFLYYREFGPSVIKGFVYLFFDTLNRSFVLMESNHLGSSSAEYGACRINGDTLVLTPFVYSSTFLYLTDYIRENTNLDDEQIEKELDLLGENNSSDTVRSLYNEWCSLRFKPIDVPVFRSKKESINLCLDPDKFSEYRYIMKGRKLINITAKEIKYRQHNILLQDLYKVDLPIPPEKEAFRKIILYSYKDLKLFGFYHDKQTPRKHFRGGVRGGGVSMPRVIRRVAIGHSGEMNGVCLSKIRNDEKDFWIVGDWLRAICLFSDIKIREI